MGGDFESVAQALLQVARDNVMTRDLTLGAIRRALQELIVHFPVYRTYISAKGRSADDNKVFQQAMEGARSTLNEGDWPVLGPPGAMAGWPALAQSPGGPRAQDAQACLRALPATDLACRRQSRERHRVLIVRRCCCRVNDVGFSTEQFSAPLTDFHAANQQRLKTFPDNLLATATHDHKRGEDTRARLAVLSEWRLLVCRTGRALAPPGRATCARAPESRAGASGGVNELNLKSGSCWAAGRWGPNPDLEAYQQRLWQWQQKALREAKLQ